MKRVWIAVLKALGWSFDIPARSERPELWHCVLVMAPHTSAADFLVGVGGMWLRSVPCHIFIKKEFFRWPLGCVLRRMGCVSIDRGNPKNGLVAKAVEGFRSNADYSVALTPEATRRPVERWKRGYWEIATQAGVPIVPVCIDFGNKHMSLFDTVWPSGDHEADTRRLRGLYTKSMARHPEKFIELKKEK
ncbi:MAG: 1-acyl-sn-glycerol-3-phosphate acyltransferase [Bacteroidales bacterium]|nr:1-acyl-sn-glycerol-3-phosphate acyltransferase [Bacteroidales bacterium]